MPILTKIAFRTRPHAFIPLCYITHHPNSTLQEPWDRREKSALDIVHKLTRAVCMRHSRLQQRISDGSPLVNLPPRTEYYVPVDMDPLSSEAYVCRWLEATARDLLCRLGRVDIRILGQMGVQRKAASSAQLLVLENINDAQEALKVCGWGVYCCDFLLLPVAPSVSCSCLDALNTPSSKLSLSPSVSRFLQSV